MFVFASLKFLAKKYPGSDPHSMLSEFYPSAVVRDRMEPRRSKGSLS
jgi:hypothetical protein